MILTVTPNPCVDKTVFIDELQVGTFMRASECTCIPGGKGCNVSRAVNALGCATKAMVVVGGHPGAHVVDMITNQDGIECVPVWVQSQTRTITTVLEQSVHRQTAFFEPGPRVTGEEAGDIVRTFAEAVQGAKIVTFNGTVPDPTLKHLYRDLIPIAKKAGALTVLDAHGPEFALGLQAVPDIVKPNVAEAQELAGYPLDTPAAKWRLIESLHQKGISLVALTLGKDGALISDARDRLHVIPPAIEEVNPVGSGDAFVAGLAIGVLDGLPLSDIARLAVAAGTANAMSWDIGHFTKEQVEQLLPQVQVMNV